MKQAYSELIDITTQSLAQAQQVRQALRPQANVQTRRVAQALDDVLPLIQQAVGQAERRILREERVPAHDKLVSLFEPHTQIICRGKAGPRDTEFGHKVNYAEVEGGLISDWEVVAEGNPPDDTLLPAMLRRHCRRFGQAPLLLAGDPGLFSPANEALARQLGVRHIVLPQPGHQTAERRAYEHQTWFRQGQRFRNGIEGRISVVRRTVQLARCPNHGWEGFERWVGWGVIVANLVVLARSQPKHRRRSKHP